MIFDKNLNDFLNDINGSSPAGEDLKYHEIYSKIQEALREDLDLPQGVWVQDLKVADWKGAEKLCTETLQTRSKDLQIASWLTEIWISLYQMSGLEGGLNLVLKLSEKYWDTIHPLPQNGDMEFRMSPFLWINEKLSTRLYRIVVTAPINSNTGPQTFGQYLAVQDYVYQKNKPEGDMGQAVNDFQTSLAKTPSDFIKQLTKDTEAAISTTQNLENFLDTKFGKDGPTLYHMRQSLDGFLKYCQQTLASRGESIAEKKEEIMPEEQSTPDAPTADAGGPIKSREDAYRVIQEAADFLYKIEPHSPAPFLIRKAITWGHLSFEELMNEVVHDQGSIEDMRRLLGLNIPQTQAPSNNGRDNKKATPQQVPWTIEQSN